MPNATRVLLVEDHPVVLRGLNALIGDHDDLVVAGEAATTARAISAVRLCDPDVVVVPMRLGGTFRGVSLCRSIKNTWTARVVVFTSFTRSIDVRVALLAGADAVVSKTAGIPSIVQILHRVAAGGPPVVLAPGAATPVPQKRGEELTARELDIVELLAEGLSNHDIAARLHIEVTTVKTHVRGALRKLDATSRRDLLRPENSSPEEKEEEEELFRLRPEHAEDEEPSLRAEDSSREEEARDSGSE